MNTVKNLFFPLLFCLPFFCLGQQQHTLKLGMWNNASYSLGYEYIIPEKHSFFIDLNFSGKQQKLIKLDSIAGEFLDIGELAFDDLYLDTRIGRMVYESTDSLGGWSWGYYISTSFLLSENRKFVEAHFKKFGEEPDFRYRYGGFGVIIQYSWLIGEHWTITPTALIDFGLEKNVATHLDSRILANRVPPTFLFNLSPTLYVSYRF